MSKDFNRIVNVALEVPSIIVGVLGRLFFGYVIVLILSFVQYEFFPQRPDLHNSFDDMFERSGELNAFKDENRFKVQKEVDPHGIECANNAEGGYVKRYCAGKELDHVDGMVSAIRSNILTFDYDEWKESRETKCMNETKQKGFDPGLGDYETVFMECKIAEGRKQVYILDTLRREKKSNGH